MPSYSPRFRRLTIYHLDTTGWGVLAATLSRWAPEWWQRQVAGKAALGLVITGLGLAAVWKLVHSGWGSSAAYSLINASTLSLLGLGTLLLLPAIVRLKTQKGWVHTVVARISLYSYTLYLSHFPLLLAIRAVLGLQASSPWPVLALAILLWLALVWLVSVLVFHFFEKPVADVRERITRRVDATPFGARA